MASLLPDLDVRTVLDVVEENFQRLQLKSFACRMIYFGEHTLTKEKITEEFKGSVTDVNSSYCDIHVNGCLLVYESYFVHVIEGSEDTIHRQLRFLFKREEDYRSSVLKSKAESESEHLTEQEAADESEKPEIKMFKRMKLLIVYNTISTMIFENWRTFIAKPPALVTKLDIYAPMEFHIEQLRVCLDKISCLCDILRTNAQLNYEGLSALDPKMETLPEVALLDFLLQSPYILDLRQCVHQHRRVDDYAFYFEEVWPLPTHFTPRLLYKLKIDDSFVDPLPIMPWEVKQEKTDEEEKEERSSQSSSD